MNEERKSKVSGGRKISRRDALKGLATVPVVGAVAYGAISKSHYEHKINRIISEELGMSPAEADYTLPPPGSREIRIGIIGFGIRGKQLVQALGFVHPSLIDEWRDAAATNENDTRYSDFMKQQALNVRITAVCDIFDTYGEMVRVTAGNLNREGTGARIADMPRRYLNYRDLIASPDVDAVVIATPDHWHGPMTIEAARAGKHVYCEKPLTWTVGETYEVRKTVRESGIVFQLGHQGRQTSSYIKAREALQKNMLGKVTLVEVTT
ncbi:MAG: Gfo/Idh/MocA family protein, partial [Bacteroidales bacterium]